MSTRGFKEGGASSPSLFNVLSEVMFRELGRRVSGVKLAAVQEVLVGLKACKTEDLDMGVALRKLIALLFADDSTLPTQFRDMEATEKEMGKVAKMVGQEIHPDKTERLLIRGKWGHEEVHGPPTKCGAVELPGFQPIAKIVGGDITAEHSYEGGFRRHMKKTRTAWAIWRPTLSRQKGLSRLQKGALIKSNILTHVYYCAGVRYWSRDQFNEVDVFVNRMLRCLTRTRFTAMKGRQNNYDIRLSFGIRSARLTVDLLTLAYVGHKVRQGRDEPGMEGKREWYEKRFPEGRAEGWIAQAMLVMDVEDGMMGLGAGGGQKRTLAQQWRDVMKRAGVAADMTKRDWSRAVTYFQDLEDYAEWTASYDGGRNHPSQQCSAFKRRGMICNV